MGKKDTGSGENSLPSKLSGDLFFYSSSHSTGRSVHYNTGSDHTDKAFCTQSMHFAVNEGLLRKERTLNHGFRVRFTHQRVNGNERRGLYSYGWIIHKPGMSADCLDRRGRSDVRLEAKGRHCSGSGAGASSLL